MVEYNTLREQMIYEQDPPSFDYILEEIGNVRTIKSMPYSGNFNFGFVSL